MHKPFKTGKTNKIIGQVSIINKQTLGFFPMHINLNIRLLFFVSSLYIKVSLFLLTAYSMLYF